MHRFARSTTLAAALVAGTAGYLLGVLGSTPPAHAQSAVAWEYKVFCVLEFQVQGEKIQGEDWVKESHLDLPHKKIGEALVKDRAVMTRMLNAMAADGWEPLMIYADTITARRPAGSGK